MAILVTDYALHLRTFADFMAVRLTLIAIIVLIFFITINAEWFCHSVKSGFLKYKVSKQETSYFQHAKQKCPKMAATQQQREFRVKFVQN